MVKFQKQILLVGLGCLLLCMVIQPLEKDQVSSEPTIKRPITGGFSPLVNPWIEHWGVGLTEYYTKGLYFNGTDLFMLGWGNDGYIHLLKYNSTGDFQWETDWYDAYSSANALWSDNSSLYCTGYNSSHHLLLIKWDFEGNQLWNASFQNYTYWCDGVSVWGDGAGAVYTLAEWQLPGNRTGLLIKWNEADGSQIWNRTWDIPFEYTPKCMSGNGTHIFTSGYIRNYASSSYDLVLLQWNASDGSVLWNRTWGGSGNEYTYDLKVAGDAVYTCGYSDSPGVGSTDVFLLKWTLDGDQVWNRTWGTALADRAYCLGLTPDNSSIFVGGRTKDSVNQYDYLGLLLKWNSSGGFQYSTTWDNAFHGDSDHIHEKSAYGICANGTSLFIGLYANSFGGGTNYQLALGRWDNDMTVNDNEDPNTFLLSPSAGTRHKSGQLIDLIIQDPSGLGNTQYHWDSDGWSNLAYPYDVTLPVGDAMHTLYVYAEDPYGNWVQVSYSFTTDDTAPTLDLAAPCVNNSIYRSTTLVNFTITDDAGIGTVQYYWDAQTSNTTLGSPYRMPIVTGDTDHWLHIYANDSLGNLVEKFYNFITDDTAPTLDLKLPVTNNSVHVSGTIIELEPADLHGISKVLYHWDAEVTNVTLDAAPFQLALMATDGTHWLHAYANDTVGNWVEQLYNITTDDTAPDLALKLPLVNNSIHTSGTVIELEASDLHGVSKVLYYWDAEVVNITLDSSPFQATLPGTDGTHLFHAFTNDSLGNMVEKLFNFTTDDTHPVIGLAHLTDSSVVGAYAVIDLNIIEAGGISEVQYCWDGALFVLLTNSHDLVMPGVPGKHVLEVRVRDVAGNWGSSSFTLYTKDDGSSVTYWTTSLIVAMAGILGIHFVQRRHSDKSRKNKPEEAK